MIQCPDCPDCKLASKTYIELEQAPRRYQVGPDGGYVKDDDLYFRCPICKQQYHEQEVI